MALPAELERATGLLREGRAEAARRILVRYLQEQPGSDAGWYLLSFAVHERERQIESLQRALAINAGHAKARARLDQISASAAPPGVPAGREPPSPPPAQEHRPARRPARSTLMPPTPPPQEPEGFSKKPVRRPQTGKRRKVKSKARTSAHIDARSRTIFLASASVLVLIALLGALLFANFLLGRILGPARERATALARVEQGGAAVMLPPTWTPTPSKTPTPTPTITPSPTPTQTPTLIPPDETTEAAMELIQLEVANLRGLELVSSQPSYIISRTRVRPLLEASFELGGGTEEQVADQARSLIALGLINPTYDLYTNILNSMADSLGGFYLPWTGELFIIGSRFSGIERWIYAHEYDHALVDQQFDLGSMGLYPLCEHTSDRCNAMRALVEGDATLLMTQWWLQYAGPGDYRDILNYNPGNRVLPDQFPPPYVAPDANFPYEQGAQFVEYLYNRGNWAEVNRAYGNLPQSTEQILHPQKYLAGEAPRTLPPFDSGSSLGPGWRLLLADTMGEWWTFLLLSYSADLSAQVSQAVASQAAAGWDGDHFEVYYNDESEGTTLVARWAWDSQMDADEFQRAMEGYMTARFRGESIEMERGICWEVNRQTSCLARSGLETLWLLSSSREIVHSLFDAFPGFR